MCGRSKTVDVFARSSDRRGRCSTIHKITFPRARSVVALVPRVGGGRKIEGTRGGHGVHCLCKRAILEGRLIEIADVIHDDVAAGRAQIENVLRKTRDAIERRGEEKLRPGRQVRDDLEHGRSFPRPRHAALSRQHGHGWQIAVRLRGGQKIDAVRENADLHAAAADAKAAARRVRFMRHVTLRIDGTRVGVSGHGRAHKFYAGAARQRFNRRQRNQRADGVEPGKMVEHRSARGFDLLEQLRRHGRLDVHQDSSVGGSFHNRLQQRDARRDDLVSAFFKRENKLRIHLEFDGAAGRLLVLQSANLL